MHGASLVPPQPASKRKQEKSVRSSHGSCRSRSKLDSVSDDRSDATVNIDRILEAVAEDR